MIYIISILISTAFAQDIRLATVDNPPLGIHQANGVVDGIGVKVTKDILEKMKLQGKDIQIPPSRMPELSSEKDIVFTFASRSPEREALMNWIGKIATDNFCIMSLKKTAVFNSMEDAKKAKAICVPKGGVVEKLAKDSGLKNIDIAVDSTGCARKLVAGRVDAMLASDLVAKYLASKNGIKPEDMHCGGTLGQREYWVSTSKNLPKDTVDRLKTTFADLEKSGKIAEHIKNFMN